MQDAASMQSYQENIDEGKLLSKKRRPPSLQGSAWWCPIRCPASSAPSHLAAVSLPTQPEHSPKLPQPPEATHTIAFFWGGRAIHHKDAMQQTTSVKCEGHTQQKQQASLTTGI